MDVTPIRFGSFVNKVKTSKEPLLRGIEPPMIQGSYPYHAPIQNSSSKVLIGDSVGTRTQSASLKGMHPNL